jgi:hypothetical protein
LLVNLDEKQAHTVVLQGSAERAAEMWWIGPDPSRTDGASATRQVLLSGSRITIPPWGIAVVRLQAP